MKKDKTFIWRKALPLIAVAALALAFTSCAKEPLSTSIPGGDGGVAVRVNFPRGVTSKATTGGTEVGTTDENRLDRVAILIFNADGTKLETALSIDVTSANTSLSTSQPKWTSDTTLLITPIVEPTAPKIIYAIANWSKTTFDQATYTETMLKAELSTLAAVADINGVKAFPMLMSGSKAVPNLASDFYSVTVDMARQVSKIRTLFTISKETQDHLPQIEWQLDSMKITMVNVPNQSYVVGRGSLPAGIALLNSTPIVVDDTKPSAADQTVPATNELKWSKSVYVTENPVAGAAQANKDVSTYIVVQLPYKNRISGAIDRDNYYTVYVNDTRDAASPHKVLRNTIYNFSIRIVGMGLPFNNLVPDVNIDDLLTVNSWEKGEIGDVDAPNRNFNIDSPKMVFQIFANSFKSTISTDVTDWKLVKEDNSTMFSFSEGKTADVTLGDITYTLAGRAGDATITVSKPVTTTAFATQKLFFVAKNLRVPLTVIYDNGIIPNSILEAAGWPADKLPATGLQLAKRGNLPLDTPTSGLTYDPSMKWSTENESTGISEIGFGSGQANYAQLSALDAATYPVGQACKDLGPEWYLPSRDELKLLWDNRAIFGSSYAPFATNGMYWSSSENGKTTGWMRGFYIGGANTGLSKTKASRVRCVKDI